VPLFFADDAGERTPIATRVRGILEGNPKALERWVLGTTFHAKEIEVDDFRCQIMSRGRLLVNLQVEAVDSPTIVLHH
jgi:hypothetical protein